MGALLVIYNGKAGGTDDETVAAVTRTLEAGASVALEKAESAADLRRLLTEHRDRRPVVLGGDGSFHLLAASLQEDGRLGDQAVGLVPLGTGNDLARSLGIPLDPTAAADVVLHGEEKPLDILLDDAGGVVVNAVHLGIGAEAAERAAPLKRGLGRFAYLVGALLAGVRGPGWRTSVTVDGGVVANGSRRVLMIGIGNGISVGGGTPLAPRADPHDGLVDVIVSFSTGPLSRLRFGILLGRGRHPRRRDVITVRGREVTVRGEPIPVNADGEVGESVSDRTWTVRPAALRITVPGRQKNRGLTGPSVAPR